MKAVFSILFLLVTYASVAQADVLVELNPASPVVISANLTLDPGTDQERTIFAPWFRTEVRVTNREGSAISIKEILASMASQEGKGETYSIEVPAEKVLQPGESATFSDYVDELPQSQSNIYDGIIRVFYSADWISMGSSVEFKTQ